MPESPEVVRLASQLRKRVGDTLKSVKLLKGRYRTHGPPEGYASFIRDLPLRCTSVKTKGKVTFINFSKKWTLIVKLGMTGWFRDRGPGNVLFQFSDPLFFVDQRSFGTLTFTKDPSKEMNKLGLDIQSLRFSELWSRVQRVKLGSRTIEDVLMDQKLVVSGIGNYLKSEVLFLAKIVPFRKASTLTRGDWYRIFRAIQKKLKNRTMYVYQQKVPWVHTYKFKGRTTWWVPGVQI